ncbi:hypothetical protein DICPUDRAFT_96298 [Dictyostelium purpureum]|uniref:Aminopeptidase P N-terminal domain-containing protein n=1 Tax=Dictyostelium purpureum TaxID=5786 RepID=F0Z725_DICPU|nr:uncharacterized protein DICPUDRAFT_96298 [Dictyostelium purpureum]EGC40260.1 hypothetical protein DICPUDRAFT_96298 [Dictyostelium purpureum]|eukprot:XP_003283196.1 hypothetical protein DICPUDRAFT_96298 [Dictyostelium purpureum]
MKNLIKINSCKRILNISNRGIFINNNNVFLNNNNNKVSNINKRYFTNSNIILNNVKPLAIGQPTHETHPHLLEKDEVTKGIKKEEFKERRNKLLKPFAIGSIVVLFTPPEPMMSYDIPWDFRQNTNFNYFTGFNEPEAVLVLEKTSDVDHISYMFVRERQEEKEKWDGPRCGGENVNRFFGIDYGYNLNETQTLLKLLTRNPEKKLYCNIVEWNQLFSKLQGISEFQTFNIEKILQQCRLIKSNSEVKQMLNSGEIAGESFSEVMKYIKPGMNEYEISAYFEWNVKKRGAKRMSYPPVVAGGNNANTLHYIANNQILKDGDLLLMDAGCEHWGYTSDITRTFPVNGRFTEAQRKVYEAVLDVNKKCIEMCVAGESINSIHDLSIQLTKEHLKNLGILHDNNPNTYSLYYPHSIGHYLGMDTHDTIDFSYGVTLEPGMIITIEPGIYISKYDQNVPEEYRGINIRVEDDVVVSQKNESPLVLTYRAPKEIKDIENIMNK